MTSYVPPRKNSEFIIYVSLASRTDGDIFQANPSLSSGDVKTSQNGDALENITTLPVVTPASSKVIKVTLSAAEMNADNVTVVFSDVAGDEWQDMVLSIQTTAQQIDDLSTVTVAQVNEQAASALGVYDAPTSAEMDTAHALLATPAQVATALNNYDSPTKAEMDAGHAALTDVTAAEVWANSSRTLTQAAASVVAAVSGSEITIARGDTLSASLTGLGSLSGYVSIDFTVKLNKDAADSAAIINIRKNQSGSGDGLLVLNGATAGTAGNGSITIDDEDDGDITIALAAAETDDLTPIKKIYYDVQMITATAVSTLTAGYCTISADVTKAVT